MIKKLPAKAEDIRDTGLIPGWGKSPAVGYGNPHQYVCLENPMERGAWRTTVHRVTKSQTRLSAHTAMQPSSLEKGKSESLKI